MLKVTTYILGEVAVLECQGRIVAGVESTTLRNAVVSLATIGAVILDLAQVDRIDADGVGVLLDLRARCRAKGTQLQLMNVPRRVRQVLEVTHLHGVLEISLVRDMSLPLVRPPASASALACPSL